MTEQNETQATALNAMRVADLQALAVEHGIKGAARMRKSQLVEAIEAALGGNIAVTTEPELEVADEAAAEPAVVETEAPAEAPAEEPTQEDESPVTEAASVDRPVSGARKNRRRVTVTAPNAASGADEAPADNTPAAAAESAAETVAEAVAVADVAEAPEGAAAESAAEAQAPKKQKSGKPNKRVEQVESDEAAAPAADEASSPKTLDDIVLPPARTDAANGGEDSDDDKQSDQSGTGRKRNRNRNRNRAEETAAATNQNQQQRQRDRRRERRDDGEPEIAPDDVLLPIAGILDVLDNYAFVRTSGYLPGPNDVYVSLGQVKKYGLRKGDAIVGAIRQPREGEHQGGRQKYNALAKIDSINGQQPEQIAARPEFDALTPLYPVERLVLETPGGHAAQRMVDLFAPIGKGTRGLIVAPPKSGKSIMLERVASAVAQNEPDAHLMLVLVGERPEEVTRLQRMIRGEVVSSTFDMPADSHTTIAELAIERAKRLVELGLDVVVLLDSLTQLCRAYNIAAPGSGRIIDGGVDASALYLPKTFFGAARKIENGGSLTILATVMVETGSRADEVILQEFIGTANMELRLSRAIAEKRIFPAVDIQQSSTLHEEDLLSEAELAATWKIRRALGGDAQGALESVLDGISRTETNAEFLRLVNSESGSVVTK